MGVSVGRQCNLTSSSLLVESFTAFLAGRSSFPVFAKATRESLLFHGAAMILAIAIETGNYSSSGVCEKAGRGKIKVNICDVISVAFVQH